MSARALSANRVVTFLTDDVRRALDAVAHDEQTSRAAVARRILNNALRPTHDEVPDDAA